MAQKNSTWKGTPLALPLTPPTRHKIGHFRNVLLSSFFSSPILGGRRLSTILPHMMWPYGANLQYMSEMCSTWLAENTGRKKRYRPTMAQLCRALSSHRIHNRKKLVKQQCLPHMSSQCGELRPLTAEIGSGVCSTPANFNGFRVLASLLHRRLS